MKTKNKWKISTFVLSLVILGMLMFSIIQKEMDKSEIYQFEEIKIPKEDFTSLVSGLGAEDFVLCDTENDKCVLFVYKKCSEN